MCHFERSESESRNLFFNRFLHFGPLCGPTVEMTKAQIIIAIGISPDLIPIKRAILLNLIILITITGFNALYRCEVCL